MENNNAGSAGSQERIIGKFPDYTGNPVYTEMTALKKQIVQGDVSAVDQLAKYLEGEHVKMAVSVLCEAYRETSARRRKRIKKLNGYYGKHLDGWEYDDRGYDDDVHSPEHYDHCDIERPVHLDTAHFDEHYYVANAMANPEGKAIGIGHVDCENDYPDG